MLVLHDVPVEKGKETVVNLYKKIEEASGEGDTDLLCLIPYNIILSMKIQAFCRIVSGQTHMACYCFVIPECLYRVSSPFVVDSR
ncbi:MAG: hypothetical protein A2293_01155 [Elusimicrobia bacterium RIFOXYB2_FULL_49_7]|nr:MAG: hypothetical protein A2293_01155 [Elusimicrobia bacterium RIFOXYB2_FULL_49_7]